MILRAFTGWDDVVVLLSRQGRTEEEIMARRALIVRRMNALAMYRKAAEWRESEDGKCQAIQPEDLLELSPVARHLERGATADAISVGATIEHTAGPSWQQRVHAVAVALFVVSGVVGVAILTAWAIASSATAIGARFLS